MFLFRSYLLVSGRCAFFTVTGKGGRTRRFPLGRWRWPLCAVGLGLGVLTTVVPVLVLAASSLAPQAGAFLSNWTLHFWLGEGGGQLAQGQAGIFRRSEEHTSELQSLMRISYAVFCLKKKKKKYT